MMNLNGAVIAIALVAAGCAASAPVPVSDVAAPRAIPPGEFAFLRPVIVAGGFVVEASYTKDKGVVKVSHSDEARKATLPNNEAAYRSIALAQANRLYCGPNGTGTARIEPGTEARLVNGERWNYTIVCGSHRSRSAGTAVAQHSRPSWPTPSFRRARCTASGHAMDMPTHGATRSRT